MLFKEQSDGRAQHAAASGKEAGRAGTCCRAIKSAASDQCFQEEKWNTGLL
ncbi:hypothetical protein GCWU000341_01021 [Oribacterium sp. oral taxon 078 str. F0262]|nr:hypothetical protein GCWU000341_01021 [Oribacterium sp. oral taxon 078 str. F0262]